MKKLLIIATFLSCPNANADQWDQFRTEAVPLKPFTLACTQGADIQHKNNHQKATVKFNGEEVKIETDKHIFSTDALQPYSTDGTGVTDWRSGGPLPGGQNVTVDYMPDGGDNEGEAALLVNMVDVRGKYLIDFSSVNCKLKKTNN